VIAARPGPAPAVTCAGAGGADDSKEGPVSTSQTDEYYELLAHRRPPVTVAAGEVIFRQGETGDSMYVIREGTVDLRDGERVVAQVEAPGLFGEMALIDDEPRTLTAAATTDAVLVRIPASHFWVLVHDTPYFAQLVMSVMARRMRAQGGST
jgi:CRP/FNR family transcriptional regulator, cyclic AMP receptor protein